MVSDLLQGAAMKQTHVENAPVVRRVIAWLADVVILYFVVVYLETYLLTETTELVAYVTLGAFASGYYILKDSVRGRSIGKLCTGMQVADIDNGRPLSALRSIKRNALPVVLLALAVSITHVSRHVIGDEIAADLGAGLIIAAFAVAFGGAFMVDAQTAGDRLARAKVQRAAVDAQRL